MNQLETFFTVTEQSQLLLYAVLLGVPLGFCYDLLRTIRLVLPHGRFTVAIEDIVFLLFCGGALLSFSVVLARGEVRGYYVLGALLGFLLYRCTLGTLTVPLLRRLLLLLKKILSRLLSPLFHGSVRICSIFKRKFVHSAKVSEKVLFFSRFPLIVHGKMLYNKSGNSQQEAKHRWQRKKRSRGGSSDSSPGQL